MCLHFDDDVSHKNSDYAYLHLWSIFRQIFTKSVKCHLSNFRDEITKKVEAVNVSFFFTKKNQADFKGYHLIFYFINSQRCQL